MCISNPITDYARRIAALRGADMEHIHLRNGWQDSWLGPHNAIYKDGDGKSHRLVFRPWQKLAITFLKSRMHAGFALVGDEMGIGKVVC